MSKLALMSVTDKTGLDVLALFMANRGWKFLSTGGTADYLASQAHVPVIEMAKWQAQCFVHQVREAGIGDPKLTDEDMIKQLSDRVPLGTIVGGRVKSLGREKSAAILALEKDNASLAILGTPRIEMVCMNFYALAKACQVPGATIESVIESMDIGGPTGILEGIKGDRIVLCDPADYQPVMEDMNDAGDISAALRHQLRIKAINLAAGYYQPLAEFLSQQ